MTPDSPNLGFHLRSLSQLINPAGQTLYFIEEHSRTNQSSYLRAFVLKEVMAQCTPIEVTALVRLTTGLSAKDRFGTVWLNVRGNGFNRAAHICDAIAGALKLSNATPLRAVIL